MIKIRNIFNKMKTSAEFCQRMNFIQKIQEYFTKTKLRTNLFIYVVFPLALLLIMELFNKQNIIHTLYWFIISPLAVVLNYILIILVFFAFLLLLGRVYLSASATIIIMSFFSFVSANKKSLLGEPLLPWDFMMIKLATNLLPNVYHGIEVQNILILLLAVFLIAVVISVTKKYSVKFRYRFIAGILAILLLGELSINSKLTNIMLVKIGVKNIDWAQTENYKTNGIFLAFMMNMKNIIISKPEQYSEKILHEKVEAIKTLRTNESEEFEKPNVIIVMSEAFWDPTLLKDVSFSKDPMPTFHSLSSKHTSGYLLSPTYGGGTSTVEFEVLTGDSMSYFPDGANPYQQYINKKLPSLASIFAEKGYKSIALHTYYKWFFNRDKVYKFMGFEKFIGFEDLINPVMKGFYAADQELTNLIINEHKNAGEQPVFMYAISMQNHGPYDLKRYEGYDIEIKADNISEESKGILEEYTQGVYDADKELKRLTEYFENVKRPTVIVFFGDHLPMLGNDFAVYKEARFINMSGGSWSREEYKALHATPLLIWTNYESQKSNVELSSYYLGSYLMNMIKMEKPLYFQFLDDLYHKLPVSLKYLKVDSKNQLYSQTPDELKDYDNTHWLFQYDRLFGKGYAISELFDNMEEQPVNRMEGSIPVED